jgi:hypothetical protein
VDTDDGDAMDEASGTSYARVLVNIVGGASPAWLTPALGVVDNEHAITFPTAGGSWGTVTSVAIMDGATLNAGNLLFYDNTLADQAVTTGDTVSFAAGSLDVVCT